MFRECLAIGTLLTTMVGADPSAISVPVRSSWRGYDGRWSPISIRVGTPPQWVDLFVSTASQETWVIGPGGGCYGNPQCIDARGGIFMPNQSSSWHSQGTFGLGLDPQLNLSGNGDYGLDSIAFDDHLSVPSQIVGVINSTDFLLGFFGLGVKPTNLTSSNQKPFLNSLVEDKSAVPSHSYGFTAGASHRLKGVPSSLTLGGYDANRFVPNNVSFALDNNKSPVVSVNRITASATPSQLSNVTNPWKNGAIDLLLPDQADLFVIDSSTPYLWLPEVVCMQFEKALGLTYDANLGLYMLSTTSRDTLTNWNISFQFTLADLPDSSKTISITLPYAAFNLQLSYPFPGLNATQYSSATNYFPLRKAANATQYTLGRAFLQESYLIVDYERNNFSVNQALFSAEPNSLMQIVDISRPANSTWTGPRVNRALLPKGAIAGLVIGAVIVLLALTACIFCCFKRRHSKQGFTKEKDSPRRPFTRFLRALICLPNDDSFVKIDGVRHFEAPCESEVRELPGTGDAQGFYHPDTKESVVNAIGHDPTCPVELPYRSSHYNSSLEYQGKPSQRHHLEMHMFAGGRLDRQRSLSSADISSPTENGTSGSPNHIVSPISAGGRSLDASASMNALLRTHPSPAPPLPLHSQRAFPSTGGLSPVSSASSRTPARSREDSIPTDIEAEDLVAAGPPPPAYSSTLVPRQLRASSFYSTDAGRASAARSSMNKGPPRGRSGRDFSWVDSLRGGEHYRPPSHGPEGRYTPDQLVDHWQRGTGSQAGHR